MDTKNIIAVNVGSKSKKYAYFEGQEQKIYKEYSDLNDNSFEKFVNENNISLENILIGIRIVAPGNIFVENKLIDDEYIDRLKQAESIAPLHIELVIKEIDFIKQIKNDLRIYAISDSSFHKSIPKYAKTYAIPKKLREDYNIERQGYHGLSLLSVVNKIQNELGVVPEKIIVCHLGGGSSITALLDGMSIDTSMGFTPLEGVIMAERSGSIDPGAISYISNILNLDSNNLTQFLSKQCGLEALSEIDGGNMRDVIDQRDTKPEANFALETYTYSIKKEIGKMYAILNGCDMLVFTGTIGTRAFVVREMIIENLESLGLSIDKEKNKNIYEPEKIEFIAQNPDERKVVVLKVDEMKSILNEVLNINM